LFSLKFQAVFDSINNLLKEMGAEGIRKEEVKFVLDKLPDSVIKHSTAVAKAGTKKSPLT
jgi:hypothetical protein